LNNPPCNCQCGAQGFRVPARANERAKYAPLELLAH
jgi:hypothetical protein